MLTVKITGLSETQSKLIDLPKQVRFAEMLAINETAKVVQQHELESILPGALTLRSKGSPWWKPGSRFGINIKPFATKTALRAVIGSQADWLRLVEEGGTKTASGHRLAIEAGARPSETSVIPRALKPRELLKRSGDIRTLKSGKSRTVRKGGRGFIITNGKGSRIYIREGGALKRLYTLNASANVKATLGFFSKGKAKVEEIYAAIFQRRLQHAIATAK